LAKIAFRSHKTAWSEVKVWEKKKTEKKEKIAQISLRFECNWGAGGPTADTQVDGTGRRTTNIDNLPTKTGDS